MSSSTPSVDEREQQRLAELEALKVPKISAEELAAIRAVVARSTNGWETALSLDQQRRLLDEIDRLELRWTRMATGGPLGVLRRENRALSAHVQRLGVHVAQQGRVIERLKVELDAAQQRAAFAEVHVEVLQTQSQLDAKVYAKAGAVLDRLQAALTEEQTNHEVTRQRLAEARGGTIHGDA